MYNGREVLIFPIHRKRAAAGQHQHNGLAGGVKRFQQIILHFRQFKMGSVAAFKAIIVDFHLLAFQLRSNTADKDDNVGAPGEIDGPLPVIDVQQLPLHEQLRPAGALKVFYFDRVRLAFFQVNVIAFGGQLIMLSPIFDDNFAING
ncbi:MAG: hypothetical protein ALAOOOJD_02362 [bacterium]|nr:hypothetical protein [bacterium]